MGVVTEGVDLLKLVNKAQNADLYRELTGWIDKVRDLQRENDQLSSERKGLQEKLRVKEAIERINGHVFIQGDDEEVCPRCAEVDRRIVHLLPRVPQKSGWPMATCPECKTASNSAEPLRRESAFAIRK